DYGQILAHNDCILRLTGIAKFVAFVDLDEYIAVSKEDDFDNLNNSLIRLITKKEARDIGGFRFRSSYVPLDWPVPGPIKRFDTETGSLPAIFENLLPRVSIQREGRHK